MIKSLVTTGGRRKSAGLPLVYMCTNKQNKNKTAQNDPGKETARRVGELVHYEYTNIL